MAECPWKPRKTSVRNRKNLVDWIPNKRKPKELHRRGNMTKAQQHHQARGLKTANRTRLILWWDLIQILTPIRTRCRSKQLTNYLFTTQTQLLNRSLGTRTSKDKALLTTELENYPLKHGMQRQLLKRLTQCNLRLICMKFITQWVQVAQWMKN